jgi:hypothetical protein
MPRTLLPRRPVNEALKRVGNPYAVLQTGPVPGDVPEWADALGFAQAEQAASTRPAATSSREAKPPTKSAYRSEVSRILLGYLPRGTTKRLRAHHREFIARTEARTPAARGQLLANLRKYDLADVPGLQPQFNRERDTFTREKLAAIERAVDD